jgi:hypothetical protein
MKRSGYSAPRQTAARWGVMKGVAASDKPCVFVLLGVLAAVLVIFSAPAVASTPLETGIIAGGPFYGRDANLAFERTRGTGSTAVRLDVSWREVAPVAPPGFDATNPADPAYNWFDLDRLVQLAALHGLTPIVTISGAPDWAERTSGGRRGTNSPDPVELGRFARAAALRYSGTFGGLPRVPDWEVWNEANASFFLSPQNVNNPAASADLYRRMVNEFAAGVHSVHADNVVVAGGLFPFVLGRQNAQAIGPMPFMRELLCMNTDSRPRHNCGPPVHFDAWSHHPYTSGGPTHKAGNADSVSIGDLPRMRRLLSAAVRAGRVVHNGPVRFWVTEFSWDSSPPDPNGVPNRLLGRWVAEALYRMWRSGVSLVTWFQLRDDLSNGAADNQVFQSGLYFRCSAGLACDSPKPAFTAFRFPFVAFRSGKRVQLWGRIPAGRAGKVTIQQRSTSRKWRRVAKLRSNGNGIFSRRLKTRRRGAFRAVLPGGEKSLSFSLRRPPDRSVNPFG